jgi:hypothetical protein
MHYGMHIGSPGDGERMSALYDGDVALLEQE